MYGQLTEDDISTLKKPIYDVLPIPHVGIAVYVFDRIEKVTHPLIRKLLRPDLSSGFAHLEAVY